MNRDDEAKRLLNKWANYCDHDLCFDADEILAPLCELFEIPINRKLNLTREQFCNGCSNYQDKLFPPAEFFYNKAMERSQEIKNGIRSDN